MYRRACFAFALFVLFNGLFYYPTRSIVRAQVIAVQRFSCTYQPWAAVLRDAFLVMLLIAFVPPSATPLRASELGILVYGAHHAMSATILRKWNPLYAVMEMMWGGLLMGTIQDGYNRL
jgi:hypothetical protein